MSATFFWGVLPALHGRAAIVDPRREFFIAPANGFADAYGSGHPTSRVHVVQSLGRQFQQLGGLPCVDEQSLVFGRFLSSEIGVLRSSDACFPRLIDTGHLIRDMTSQLNEGGGRLVVKCHADLQIDGSHFCNVGANRGYVQSGSQTKFYLGDECDTILRVAQLETL